MQFIGIDLSKRKFTVAYMNEDGVVVGRAEFGTGDEGLRNFLRTVSDNDQVALEAGCGMYRFYDLIEPHVAAVKVINTYKFKVIKTSIRKTDANDAELIARFLRMNELPEVFVVEKAYRIIRELTAFRRKLVGQSTMMRNRIQALFQKNGIVLERRMLDNPKHRNSLLTAPLPDEALFQVRICLSTMDVTERSIGEVEVKMRSIVRSSSSLRAEVRKLLQVPGIGELSAVTICGEIGGKIERFRTKKEFAAYAGLVSRTQQSGDSNRQVSTKRGRTELKTSLIHAVLTQVGRYSNPIVDYYCRKRSEKCVGKAVMACARKLLTGIYIMLKYGKDYYYVEKELYYRKLGGFKLCAG